ncbi:hypothetical protein GCM10027447_03780 [Glycomyces halotolerans]
MQGADASSAEFTIDPGERARFTSAHGVAVRHQPGFHTRLYQVSGASDFLPTVTRDAARSASLGCLVTVVGLVTVIVGAVWAALTGSQTAEIMAATAVLLAAVGLMTGVVMGVRTAQRVQRRVEASRIGVERRRTNALAFASPYYLRRLDSGSTGAALVFDLFLYRVERRDDGSVAYTGEDEELPLAHAGPVRLWIDDVEAPCDWSTWFYPLDEGRHSFRVQYGPDRFGETAHHRFALVVQGLSVVHVPVRVFRIAAGGTVSSLPPQVSHRITLVGAFDRRHDDWLPSRMWPEHPGPQA